VVYRFGDFTLDHDIRQLFRGGTELHLSPKAFELLTILLVNRSRAVSKRELQEHLWPSTFVEETNLAGLIAEIRRALQDSASTPSFVRTVYRFGYRFVGDVSADAAVAPSHPRGVKLCLIVDAREVVLLDGANVIGREPDATIQIDARGVSRQHARILVAKGEAMLEDLGSKNGTHINGHAIAGPTHLCDGDEIAFGTVRVKFRVASETSPTETLPWDNR
jgi:DNA-binding winged helix-turn-helix (wHTH) protein